MNKLQTAIDRAHETASALLKEFGESRESMLAIAAAFHVQALAWERVLLTPKGTAQLLKDMAEKEDATTYQ